MSETKHFPTCAVISAIGGSLCCEIGQVYEVLGWMSGESVWTHQLPRVGREATPVVLAMHPALQEALDECERVNRDNWHDYAAKWVDRYGPEIAVPRFNRDQHESIDPVSELAEIVHPENIVVVQP